MSSADAVPAAQSAENVAIHRTVAELATLPGPSGHEDSVRTALVESWRKRKLECEIDRIGNALGHVTGEGPRVLLQAHMDEIGYVVRGITDSGFLLLTTAQGSARGRQDRRYVVSQAALVLGRLGVVKGVFGAAAGHVMSREQLDAPGLTIDDFFVDIGAESAEQVSGLGITVGAPVVCDAPTQLLRQRLVGKALDDRAMLAVMNLLLDRVDRQALRVDLWVAATVQEENGTHGAHALAAREQFDAVIALDVGLAGDLPTLKPGQVPTYLGCGATIVHQDEHVAYDKRLTCALSEAAAEASVSVQHAAFGNYGTDGKCFIDAGSPTALLGIPVRYTHTAAEMADVRDIKGAVAVLERFVTREPDWRP